MPLPLQLVPTKIKIEEKEEKRGNMNSVFHPLKGHRGNSRTI